jgi:hypothetical protein
VRRDRATLPTCPALPGEVAEGGDRVGGGRAAVVLGGEGRLGDDGVASWTPEASPGLSCISPSLGRPPDMGSGVHKGRGLCHRAIMHRHNMQRRRWRTNTPCAVSDATYVSYSAPSVWATQIARQGASARVARACARDTRCVRRRSPAARTAPATPLLDASSAIDRSTDDSIRRRGTRTQTDES